MLKQSILCGALALSMFSPLVVAASVTEKVAHDISDSAITTAVKATLLEKKIFGDKNVELWTVHVETTDGIVALTGTVDTDAECANIIDAVKKVHGVKSVESAITVK
jgi:hyperosmotically inducible protein